jgi:hypothetical protein
MPVLVDDDLVTEDASGSRPATVWRNAPETR